MGREKNFGDKINSNGFDKKPENINRNGQPLSFKADYRKILESNNGIIWRNEEDLIIEEKNGKKRIGFQLTKVETILAKLDELIMNPKNDKISLDAIKFIWEQIDGKPKQEIDMTTKEPIKFINPDD